MAITDILDQATPYDERGFRGRQNLTGSRPGSRGRGGWKPCQFPSQVQRPPLRQLTEAEGALLVEWLASRRAVLLARFYRTFWRDWWPPDADTVENCLNEGVFHLIDVICQQPQAWTDEEFQGKAFCRVWGGMVLAILAMRFQARNPDGRGRRYAQLSEPAGLWDQPTELAEADQAEQRRTAGKAQPVTDEVLVLVDLLTRLDEGKFEVLMRYYVDEQTIGEIAASMGITYEAVYERLKRMGARLRNQMEAESRTNQLKGDCDNGRRYGDHTALQGRDDDHRDPAGQLRRAVGQVRHALDA